MLRHTIIYFFSFGLFFIAKAQGNYIDVPQTVIAKDINGKKVLRSSHFGNQMNQLLNTFLNVYEDNKKSRESVESVRAKTEIIKETYSSYEVYPDSIVRGWHSVTATDHQNFCKDVFVLVEKNKVIEFVIDGCIRIGCHSIGTIKKGKGTVTLDNFNGESSELVNVYFIQDMEHPALVKEPIQPGYICFWTNKNNYVGERIIMNGMVINGIEFTSEYQPECFEEFTTVTMILKPSIYNFLAKRRGNDHEGSFEIKSGKCLMYKLP